MIKAIQNWLEVSKQKKLEKKLIEMRDDAKKIISGVMLELLKYDISFRLSMPSDVIELLYGVDRENCITIHNESNKLKIWWKDLQIATYETASWWQKMKHKRNLKKFIYTEDAVKAISNMIIMGEAI